MALLLSAIWFTSLPQAQAADTSAAAAAALKVLTAPLNAESGSTASGAGVAHAEGGARITVQKGESIDAVIRRGLPGLPLKEEFLRQALANANPKIFPRGRTYPVRPGTVLALPSPEALRQQILAQAPQAAVLFQVTAPTAEESTAPTGPDKRRWVRFP